MKLFIYTSFVSEALALMHIGEILSGVTDCGDEVAAATQGTITTAVGQSRNSDERVVATFDRRDGAFRMIGPEGYVRGMSIDWADRTEALIAELPDVPANQPPVALPSAGPHVFTPLDSAVQMACRHGGHRAVRT